MSYSRAFLPVISSLGTLFSSAGSALFGTSKILEYIYVEDEKVPDNVRLIAYTIVITSNFIVMTDTRVSTIMRDFIKKTFSNDEEPAESKTQPNDNILSLENTATHQDSSSESFTLSSDTQIPYSQLADTIEASPHQALTFSTRLISPPEEILVNGEPLSLCRQRTGSIIAGILKVCGLSSTFFSALPSYLGAVVFYELMAGGDPSNQDYDDAKKITLIILMHLNALVATSGKFQANFRYNYPAIRKSAEHISHWVVKYPSDIPEESRWLDVKKYLATLSLCSLNILSTPFLAFFTTSQTLKKIPFIRDYHSFIDIFSACSTTTAVTSSVLATAPAVRDSFEKWWYKQEEDSERITAVYNAKLKSFQALNILIGIAGSIDSLATGVNNCVSVILTSNELFKINKYHLALILFAGFSGLSATIVNAAFSVRRGHRAFIKNELYDLYSRLGYLSPISSLQNNLQEVLIHNNNDDVYLSVPEESRVVIEEVVPTDATEHKSDFMIHVTPADMPVSPFDLRAHAASTTPIPIHHNLKKLNYSPISKSLDLQNNTARFQHGFFSQQNSPSINLHVTHHEHADTDEDKFGIFLP